MMVRGVRDLGASSEAARPWLERHEELQIKRQPAEALWRRTGEFLNASSDTYYQLEKNALRRRRRLDMTLQLANNRLSAILFGFLFSPWAPFMEHYVPGFEPSHEGQIYLEKLAQAGHDLNNGERSRFSLAIFEILRDCCGYGNGAGSMVDVLPGEGLSYGSIGLFDAWIDQNERGQIDTFHRRHRLPAYRAAKKWSNSQRLTELAKRTPQHMVDLLECVWPRHGGVVGGASANKPWTSAVIDMTHGQALSEGGYDDFPYFYMRFNTSAGALYGTGPGIDATPTQAMMEALKDGIVRNVDLRNDPPLFKPRGAFKTLDRRPTGVTEYDDSILYARSAQQAIFALPVGGDSGIGVQMLSRLEEEIMGHYYTDWFTPGEHEGMSATEVLDRRDTRLRGLSPMVMHMHFDLSPMPERLLPVMWRQQAIALPPEEFDGKDIRTRFRSPLQQIQRQQSVEEMLRGLAATAKVGELASHIDPVMRVDGLARQIAIDAGTPLVHVRSADEIAQRRQDEEQQAQLQAQAELAKTAAPAVQAGAQLQQVLQQ